METYRRTVIGTIACALLLTPPILAHHSTRLFDQTQLALQTGKINEFEWINPHAWLHVDLTDENGNVTTWALEGGSIIQLTRLGWSRNDFHPGTEITVGFRPMRDGSRGGQLMSATLPDGRQVCSNRGCG